MIVRPDRLRELVLASQQAGGPTAELVVVVQRLARLVVRRRPWLDPEDVSQQALLGVVQHLDRLDPDGNLFGYLLTCCRSAARTQQAQDRRAQLAVEAATERHRQQGG